MSDGTKIEWTEATWNPITGCSVHSPGCTNCYAMKLAGTRLQHHPSRAGLTVDTKAGPVWTGAVRFNEQWLDQPLRWKRPRMIFVCAHGDLFHESVPDEWIDRVFAVMALAPQHTFQVLTKRSARMREYLAAFQDRPEAFARAMAFVVRAAGRPGQLGLTAIDNMLWPIPNIWLGVSVEDQARADERIPDLLATPAAVRWLSCEPLLGRVDLTMLHYDGITNVDCLRGMHGARQPMLAECDRIDWIVAGGESGHGARPMHPDWARSLRDQCAAAGVPFFFKQWGEWEVALDRERDDPDWRADYINNYVDHGRSRWLNLEGGRGFHGDRFHVMRNVGKKRAGRTLDGVTHDAIPTVSLL